MALLRSAEEAQARLEPDQYDSSPTGSRLCSDQHSAVKVCADAVTDARLLRGHGSSPLNPCQSPFSCCSQRITGCGYRHGNRQARVDRYRNRQRYVRRDEKGRVDEVVDVVRSLSQDRKRQAEHETAASAKAWLTL